MEDHREDLAIIICTENGKPLAESRVEIAYGASFMTWNAAEALRYVKDEVCKVSLPTGGYRTYGQIIPSPYPGTRNTVIKQPIGVCGLITPW